MSQQESFTREDIRASFDVAQRLMATAMDESARAAPLSQARELMTGVSAALSSAGEAFDAADPSRAAEHLVAAARDLRLARGRVAGAPGDPDADRGDRELELLDQAAGAIEQAAHRMRNATTRHTTFGAIRTPPSERLPLERPPGSADSSSTDRTRREAP